MIMDKGRNMVSLQDSPIAMSTPGSHLLECGARHRFSSVRSAEALRAQPKRRTAPHSIVGWMILFLTGFGSWAQSPEERPVVVTLRADAVSLNPGEGTTVRAFAQVSPGFQARADRIFTWNLDLLILAPEVIALEAGSLVRPRSDRDPILGSAGTMDGSNLLSVRDSFLNLEGAGVASSIELFSVRVKAVEPGAGLMRLRAGTIGTDSSPDFLVLPLGDEEPWSGADYTAATVSIGVGGGGTVEAPRLRVERAANGVIRVTVEGTAGTSVALEEAERIGGGVSWRRVGASAAGSATLTFETPVGAAPRFYRGVGLTAVP